VGRASGTKGHRRELTNTLRIELERQIERGCCAYCRAPARPDRPLTREHVIPRARGGRRKDIRIIVPACARCNHHRGCRDLIPFLLARPRRISSFIDYLAGLSPESIRELDLRIFAELYTAVAMLNECRFGGPDWRWELRRLCSGRALHRRRYATRRAVGSVSGRMQTLRARQRLAEGPSCPVPLPRAELLPLQLDEPLERMAARLLSLLAMLWEVSAELVEREMTRALSGSAVDWEPITDTADPADVTREDDGVVPLDGWAQRPKRRRMRVDRRQGRPVRHQRATAPARGRAA
jgi:hypothetical protein